jgi:asparagine synthase (glutamine-hydrolysing)
MSAQFGSWNMNGEPVDQKYQDKVASLLEMYGPDGRGSYSEGDICFQYHSFRTTKESHWEKQPYVSPSGLVFMWDGRLDNRDELLAETGLTSLGDITDVSIVVAIYEQQGVKSFARLAGDWALSIWDPSNRSLTLARDFMGLRPLYYSAGNSSVRWSTVLDPLVLLADRPFALNEEYLAGWFAQFPLSHLTPYIGIHAVGPSRFIVIKNRAVTVTKYWEFHPSAEFSCRSDRECEEHFRKLFTESVRRRLRSNTTVGAELSGGMDSSSIVCMADELFAGCGTPQFRVQTISYYTDADPNWDDKNFFTIVEQKRGQAGCHVDVTEADDSCLPATTPGFSVTPGSNGRPGKATQELAAYLHSQRIRVLLSGIGGDEVLGGVPTPLPELANLFAEGHLRGWLQQAVTWALVLRRPVVPLLAETLHRFLPSRLKPVPECMRPPSWMDAGFAKRNRKALNGYPRRLHLRGPTPSFQDNLNTLEVLRRQIAWSGVPSEPLCEKRYPYLDRDLLSFLFSLPPSQLLRPNQRRSLMRRALAGILPAEILSRKRKAYLARKPLVDFLRELPLLLALTEQMAARGSHFVNLPRLRAVLHKASGGEDTVPVAALTRTFVLLDWLTQFAASGHWNGILGRD